MRCIYGRHPRLHLILVVLPVDWFSAVLLLLTGPVILLLCENIVLYRGHIVKRGTHNELLTVEGLYRRLFDVLSAASSQEY